MGAGSLEELADLTTKAKAKGAEDLVLAFGGNGGRNRPLAHRSPAGGA